MYGRSVAICAAVVAAIVVVVSCAHSVSQDAATGPDGKPKGAKPIEIVSNQGHATGIVTYPGGDRVDWKSFELAKRSSVELKLTWQAPRPGLQLAIDVFDEYGAPVAQSKKSSKHRSTGHTKTLSIADAPKGKYLLRIYAVDRADAGKYKLTIETKEKSETAGGVDLAKLDIPEPPRLASLPDECDDSNFDAKRPACKDFCPKTGAPPDWPPCKDKCPTPPTVDVVSCRGTMPCTDPPDRRIAKCAGVTFPKCEPPNTDPIKNLNCDPKPYLARIIKSEIQNNEVTVTLAAGTGQGISMKWSAVVATENGTTFTGGNPEVKLVRVTAKDVVGRTKLTTEQVDRAGYVKLSPPP